MDEDNPIKVVFTLEVRIETINLVDLHEVSEIAEKAWEYGTVRLASVEIIDPGGSDD